MKTLFIFLALGVAAGAADYFYRANDLPPPGDIVIASALAKDKLSPSLRAAVNSRSKFVGVDRRGPIFKTTIGLNVEVAAHFNQLEKLRAEKGLQPVLTEIKRIDQDPVFEKFLAEEPAGLTVRLNRDLPAGEKIAGLTVAKHAPSDRWVRVTSADGFTDQDLLRLAADDAVVRVEPSVIVTYGNPAGRKPAGPAATPAGTFPDDPLYLPQQTWGMQHINAPALWNLPAGNRAMITVAVVDTGVDPDHEDLKANLVAGYNAIDATPDARDDDGHGTHCAGIIGAVGNNTRGIAGINWNVKIMPIKSLHEGGWGYDHEIANGIRHAIKHGAQVINASWGSSAYSAVIEQALKEAVSKGIIVVVAAGNDKRDLDGPYDYHEYPASLGLPGVVSVMAIDDQHAPASFTNYGRKLVTLAAPGTDILSTGAGIHGAYYTDSGTSMATPHVTGLVAALLSLGSPNQLAGKSAPDAAKAVIGSLVDMAVPAATLKGRCLTERRAWFDPAKLSALGSITTITLPPQGSPVIPPTPGPGPVIPVIVGEPVELTGTLVYGVVGIGGESTGVMLRDGNRHFELTGATEELRRKFSELDGKKVTIKGLIKTIQGVERPKRDIIEVNSLETR